MGVASSTIVKSHSYAKLQTPKTLFGLSELEMSYTNYPSHSISPCNLAQMMILLAGIQEVTGLKGLSKQIYEHCLKLMHAYFHILYKSSLVILTFYST
jgi:hypothetical protein